MSAGFFRSPELMSWHAATTVMLALTLVLTKRRGRVPALAAAALGIVCLLFGGRRKMIAMPILWAWTQIVAARRADMGRRTVGLVAASGLAGVLLYTTAGMIQVQASYYERAVSSAAEAPGRFGAIADELIRSVPSGGVVGHGVGAIATGTRYIRERNTVSPIDRERLRWGEGGWSRLVIELGVVGLLSGVALAFAVAQSLVRQLPESSTTPTAGIQAGLTGCLFGYAISYTVSHHAYGDVNIMCLTGLIAGIALSAPHWRRRHASYAGKPGDDGARAEPN